MSVMNCLPEECLIVEDPEDKIQAEVGHKHGGM
jgi:hypothetical protein